MDDYFAVFGLPSETPEDPLNALRCAEDMIAALALWNAERVRDGEPRLAIGIGLNYGPAVIGDVGSEHGLSFTVIGDMVNTAARLQGLTRVLNTPLVAGDALVQAIRALPRANGEDPLARLHDGGEHTLRGRAGPVRIWTYEPAPT